MYIVPTDPISRAEQSWLTGLDPKSVFEHQLNWLLDLPPNNYQISASFEDNEMFWSFRKEDPDP